MYKRAMILVVMHKLQKPSHDDQCHHPTALSDSHKTNQPVGGVKRTMARNRCYVVIYTQTPHTLFKMACCLDLAVPWFGEVLSWRDGWAWMTSSPSTLSKMYQSRLILQDKHGYDEKLV